MPYLYKNNESKGQALCQVCDARFSPKDSRFSSMKLRYPLTAQQFLHEFGESFKFNITQVIGLTNGDGVSKEFRPFK